MRLSIIRARCNDGLIYPMAGRKVCVHRIGVSIGVGDVLPEIGRMNMPACVIYAFCHATRSRPQNISTGCDMHVCITTGFNGGHLYGLRCNYIYARAMNVNLATVASPDCSQPSNSTLRTTSNAQVAAIHMHFITFPFGVNRPEFLPVVIVNTKVCHKFTTPEPIFSAAI